MPEKKKASDTEQVSAHIARLEPAVAEIVGYLREVILDTDPEIAEHIKWNSPAFHYTGAMKDFDPKEYKRDIVVMNLHRGKILMVFPTGARISDPNGLLEGKYPDGRRLITIPDMAYAKKRTADLKQVLKGWLDKVE